MFSQFVFLLTNQIKRAFPLLVHMKFIFSRSGPRRLAAVAKSARGPN